MGFLMLIIQQGTVEFTNLLNTRRKSDLIRNRVKTKTLDRQGFQENSGLAKNRTWIKCLGNTYSIH
jgi:hypothetical protein